MPSTDRKLELKAKTSVAQTGSQPYVYAKGLIGSVQVKENYHFLHLTRIPFWNTVTYTAFVDMCMECSCVQYLDLLGNWLFEDMWHVHNGILTKLML
jgi:hypothetical protein